MKKKSVFTASAIVAGNGIGSGVMAIPYFISKAGIINGIIAFICAYIISVLLHLMIAQILILTGDTADILSSFNTYLFRGRLKNVLKISFFVIMVVVLETNLAAYISGASSILMELFPGMSVRVFEIVCYLFASVIVLLGLHAIGISEKVTVCVMSVILILAAVFSLLNINPQIVTGILPMTNVSVLNGFAATFSMIMFSFSAIFAVPQIIECLNHDEKKIRRSIFCGLLMNLVISVVVCACAIITSKEVTTVAIVGWADAVGGTVKILGSLFILLAMLTSYWSIGFATTEIISDQTKRTFGLSFALATIPALILTMTLSNGFMEYMKIAGGAVAVIISLMLIPTYIICTKGQNITILNKMERSKPAILLVFIMYLVMAIGSLISV